MLVRLVLDSFFFFVYFFSLFFFLFLFGAFSALASLELLTSGDLPPLASQRAGITGVSHRTWPDNSNFISKLYAHDFHSSDSYCEEIY